jgi:hypothetical protein
MKTILYYSTVLIVVLTGIPAQAQEPLVLYDKFESKFLDREKWIGVQSLSAGGELLETVRLIKTEPIYLYRGLNILSRGYGSTASGDGTSFVGNRVVFPDGSGIKTVQAKVQVKRYQVTECTGNPIATEARARIGGYFFNTDIPTPGDSTNDVVAFINIGRSSSSSDPGNVLEVFGYLVQCADLGCWTGTLLDSKDLGTVRLNQRVKLRITWDQVNHQFIFQVGKGPDVLSPYAVPDTAPPGTPNGGNKRLEVAHFIANCTTAPRPVAFMEAFFDDVFVNESAIP